MPFDEISIDIVKKVWWIRCINLKNNHFCEIVLKSLIQDSQYNEYKATINPMGYVPAIKIPGKYGENVFWYILKN